MHRRGRAIPVGIGGDLRTVLCVDTDRVDGVIGQSVDGFGRRSRWHVEPSKTRNRDSVGHDWSAGVGVVYG